MLDTQMLGDALEIAGFSISCFALTLSLSQRRLSQSYLMLGLYFFAFSLSYTFVVSTVLLDAPSERMLDGLLMFSFSASFAIPPALLFYIRSLTGEDLVSRPRELALHFIPLAISILTGLVFFGLTEESRAGLLGRQQVDHLSLLGALTGITLLIMALAFYTQCLIYTVLSLRTQVRHRERLKNLFASTEPYENRWITGMALLFGLFAGLNFWSVIADVSGLPGQLPDLADSILVLLIVLTLATWGLRQSPGLNDIFGDAGSHDFTHQTKYEKSALDSVRAARIAGKLHTAMERDHLYRDPNLSLMALSQSIGVSTNYVSQTLNEHLGQSFFDFVNNWRVETAKPMIRSGKQPVTLIAYEVGFNSRSSFYTAFKRNTGQTPSRYGATAYEQPAAECS